MIHGTLKNKWDEDICLLVNVDNDKWNYLCDCGFASLLKPGECVKTKALFISHTHIDHFVNFDNIMRHQLGIEKEVTICGPPGIAQNVLGKLKGYTWNLIEEGAINYEVREIQEEGRITVFKIKPPEWKLEKTGEMQGDIVFERPEFFVRYSILDHGIPSIAYLFEERAKLKIRETPHQAGPWISLLKKAFNSGKPEMEIAVNGESFMAKDLFKYLYKKQGFRLGFVMDHKASPENHEKIIQLCHQADQVFIEAYYREVDKAFAAKNFHSTALSSGKVAREAEVKKVFFVHHSRRYSTELEDLMEEGRAAFEGRKPTFTNNPVARF